MGRHQPEGGSEMTERIEDETDIVTKPCPCGFTVMLDGKYYGIGASVEAAYDMARNERIIDTWRALA